VTKPAAPIAGVSTGSRSVTIPDQVVGADGGISVPFAGRVPVAGRSTVDVQHEIEQRLAQKAIEPQVIVTITKSVTYAATVSGEVVAGARVPLSVNGDRLLDLIALAGAAKSPVYSTNRGSGNEDSTRLKRPRQPPLVERLTTTPVITGPVTVLISVNTFCSSVNGALAT
jgi:polysaccharide biosynthesis/export protein